MEQIFVVESSLVQMVEVEEEEEDLQKRFDYLCDWNEIDVVDDGGVEGDVTRGVADDVEDGAEDGVAGGVAGGVTGGEVMAKETDAFFGMEK